VEEGAGTLAVVAGDTLAVKVAALEIGKAVVGVARTTSTALGTLEFSILHGTPACMALFQWAFPRDSRLTMVLL
jgi:hypothetical protein